MFRQFTSAILTFSFIIFISGCSNSNISSPKAETPKASKAIKKTVDPIRRGIPRNSRPHLLLEKSTNDPSYGYSKKNPINVGGSKELFIGPQNERKYLNALLGPKGQEVEYKRLGSCCHFKTKNGYNGGGLLDIYKVTYDGLKNPVLLYLNMYDGGELFIPKGFLAK